MEAEYRDKGHLACDQFINLHLTVSYCSGPVHTQIMGSSKYHRL